MIRRSAYRRRAYHLRTDGRHDEVERTWAEVRRIDGGDLALNRYQHALTFSHLGRFRTRSDYVRLCWKSDPMKVGSYVDRLDGDIALHHGHLIRSADAIHRRATLFEEQRSEKMVVELRMMEARIRGSSIRAPLSQSGPSTWQPHTQCLASCGQHGVHEPSVVPET